MPSGWIVTVIITLQPGYAPFMQMKLNSRQVRGIFPFLYQRFQWLSENLTNAASWCFFGPHNNFVDTRYVCQVSSDTCNSTTLLMGTGQAGISANGCRVCRHCWDMLWCIGYIWPEIVWLWNATMSPCSTHLWFISQLSQGYYSHIQHSFIFLRCSWMSTVALMQWPALWVTLSHIAHLSHWRRKKAPSSCGKGFEQCPGPPHCGSARLKLAHLQSRGGEGWYGKTGRQMYR